MCELVAVAWEQPLAFDRLVDRVCEVERWGIAGFGWGVAWLTDDSRVRVERGLGRFQDEAMHHEELLRTVSSRFLVHLRRPDKLSTIQLADTQPFTDHGTHAFCHNGFLARAEDLRPRFAGRLSGKADSEVGWAFLTDRLAAGTPPEEGLREVEETFGGKVNLGYLDSSGGLIVYCQNMHNRMWRFTITDGDVRGDVATTALHSSDASLFDLVFPDSAERRPLAACTPLRLGGSHQ